MKYETILNKLEKCETYQDFEKIKNNLEKLADEEGMEVDELISEDVEEFFRAAVICGDAEFVDEHLEFVEVNDVDDEYSSYLDLTDNDEIIGILESDGALRDPDSYYDADYRFCCETDTGEIISFEDEFRDEVLNKYLDRFNMTQDELIECIENEETPEEIQRLNDLLEEDDENEEVEDYTYRDFEEDMEALGLYVEDGELLQKEIDELDMQIDLRELLEFLGYEIEFEGISNKLEQAGYCFIK